jgi:hypothetical protein
MCGLLAGPADQRRAWFTEGFDTRDLKEAKALSIAGQFNGGAKAWAAAEEDEAVGQWAMPLRQPRPARGGMLELVALVFPRGQAFGRFFAAGCEQARPE